MSDNVARRAQLSALERLKGLNKTPSPHGNSLTDRTKIFLDPNRYEAEGLSIKAPAYDCKFRQVLLDLNKLTTDLLEAVPEELREHPIFSHLVQEIKQAGTCPEARKRRVHVIGKSGAGKSTLANCLIALVEFAKADSTTGCTTIPTAYESPFGDQTLDFAARIKFFSINTIRQRLESLWSDYYNFYFEDDKSDWTVEDKQDAQQAADTALDALCSLFRDKDDFKNHFKAKAELKSLRNEHIDAIVEPWVDWCRELLPAEQLPNADREKDGSDDRIPMLKFDANTQQELCDQLDVYAYPKPRQCSFWPLVDTIRVGLRGVKLLEYVTIVDWPGVGDTNDLRGKASTGRVSDCDEVWVVSDSNRIRSDPAIWHSLSRFAGSHPCLLICTKVDEKCDDFTNMEEIKSQGFDMGDLKELRAEELRLQDDVDELEEAVKKTKQMVGSEHEDLHREKRQRRSYEDLTAHEALLPDLVRDLAELKGSLEDLQHKRRKLTLQIRHKWLHSELSARIRQDLPAARSIKIFFASSDHYMACKKAKVVVGTVLDLVDTGIPALRRHVLQTASPGMVNTVKQYLSGEVKRVLEGVGVAVAPQDLEGCLYVLQHIKKKEARSVQEQNSYTAVIEDESLKRFLNPIQSKRTQFVAVAVNVVTLLRSWHHMSLKAFIRKDGDWATQTQKAQRWNARFVGTLGDVVLENWETFHERKNISFKVLETYLVNELYDILQIGDRRGAYKRLSDKDGQFRAFLETQVQKMRNKFENAAEVYALMMSGIKVDATKTGCRFSKGYFDFAMGDTYAEGRGIRGQGYKQRVNDHFENKLSSTGKKSPFISAAHYLKDAVEGAAVNHAQIAIDAFSECLSDIHGWLDGVFVEHGDVKGVYGVLLALKKAQEWGKTKVAECEHRLKMVDDQYAEEEKEVKRLERNRKDRERTAKKRRLEELAKA